MWFVSSTCSNKSENLKSPLLIPTLNTLSKIVHWGYTQYNTSRSLSAHIVWVSVFSMCEVDQNRMKECAQPKQSDSWPQTLPQCHCFLASGHSRTLSISLSLSLSLSLSHTHTCLLLEFVKVGLAVGYWRRWISALSNVKIPHIFFYSHSSEQIKLSKV